jgi:hypothetical protein
MRAFFTLEEKTKPAFAKIPFPKLLCPQNVVKKNF